MFQPTKLIVVTVMNGKFHIARKLCQYRNMANLHTLEYDRKKVHEGVESLGATDFRHYSDLTFNGFQDLFVKLSKEITNNAKAGKKTFLYFHYGGHGE